MSDWKSHLRRLIDSDAPGSEDADAVRRYVRNDVGDAFRTLKHEMSDYDMDVRVSVDDDAARIAFYEDDGSEAFRYTVRLRSTRVPNFAFPAINVSKDEARRHCAEARVNEDSVEHRDVTGWSEDALIRDVLRAYEEHVYWAHAPTA